MSSDRPLVYVAGPLFDEGERWWIEQVDQAIAGAGFDTFLPHRDNPEKTPDTTRVIFDNNKAAMDRCDVIIANLNGITTDDGTAWELGYGFAQGTYEIGMRTDWRERFSGEVVNLMMECSVDRLVRSLEELIAALVEWRDEHWHPDSAD